MRKIITLFFVFTAFTLLGQQSKKVFFIGNSYTATGNIPQLIKQIAGSSGDDMTYAAHTPGGTTFQQHVSNATVISNLAQSNWDIVVLQEQSQLPSFPQGQVEQEVFPFAAQLSNMARENNPCVEGIPPTNYTSQYRLKFSNFSGSMLLGRSWCSLLTL